MPRGDRSGPNGMGPMTGRTFGFCAGNNAPGYASAPGPGRGMAWGGGRARGFGMGRGMAWGCGGYGGAYGGRGMAWNRPEAPAAPENRKAVLEDEMAALEERMQFLKREMDAINSEKKED